MQDLDVLLFKKDFNIFYLSNLYLFLYRKLKLEKKYILFKISVNPFDIFLAFSKLYRIAAKLASSVIYDNSHVAVNVSIILKSFSIYFNRATLRKYIQLLKSIFS